MLVHVESELKHRVVGSTIDDAAGECFDKAGKLLGFLNLPILGGSEPKRQICATNLAFGGDGHDLYVSACDAVYKTRLKAEGIIAGPDGRMVSVVK